MVEGGEGEVEGCERSDFPAFPFKPYGIQLDFMRAVYSTLSRGGVGIFESPTGTGKTLSLICSSLQWLCDQHERALSLSTTNNGPAARDSSSAGTAADSIGASVDEEPDWMRDFGEKQEEKKMREMEVQREKKWRSRSKIATNGHRRNGISHLLENDHESFKRSSKDVASEIAAIDAMFRDGGSAGSGCEDELEFLVEEWDSDNDEGRVAGGKGGETKLKRKRARGQDWASLIDNQDGGGFSDGNEDDADADEEEDGGDGCDWEPLKIFFCSRTHSQLSQFVGEIKKTVFGDSGMRVISLGSRKTLCINDAVLRLGNTGAINERCLELQKNSKNKKVESSAGIRGSQKAKTKSSGSCPFLKKSSLEREFAQHVEGSPPLDIEDLVHLGRRIGTCPYYGARRLLPRADLVILPYQSLLHKCTRDSLGVNLKDSVVIFDEAHNVVDTVAAIHSYQVSGLQVVAVHSQLTSYLDRFKDRLAAGNRRHIQTLLVLTQAFIQRLGLPMHAEECLAQYWADLQENCQEQGNMAAGKSSEMMTLNDFLFSLEIDNLNLFKLERYLKESNVVHKVSSYGEKMFSQISEARGEGEGLEGSMGRSGMSAFRAFADFTIALTSTDHDGRVLVTAPKKQDGAQAGATSLGLSSLKFLMLNASKHFAEVISDARAIVLAGGTLQPINALKEQLFPQVPSNEMHVFSCGHIVPGESVLPLALAKGPTGKRFNFTFQSRSSPDQINELGRLLVNLCSIVPQGIVCFFPSFAYEATVYNTWMQTGIVSSIESKKVIFREPRNTNAIDKVLEEYKRVIEDVQGTAATGMSWPERNDGGFSQGLSSQPKAGRRTGALMLCVVGGKLSEGINFSDGMGRCVVMVGLPYPSPSDPELVERVRYLDEGPGSLRMGNHLQSKNETLATGKLGSKPIVSALDNKGAMPKLSCSSGAGIPINSAQGRSEKTTGATGSGRGREYYENLCMKAVNQSIGRAIRHANDYAAIILVDERYANPSGPVMKLPGWIKERLKTMTGSFGEAVRELHTFFRHNKLKHSSLSS